MLFSRASVMIVSARDAGSTQVSGAVLIFPSRMMNRFSPEPSAQ
jgi:hypothetical protein